MSGDHDERGRFRPGNAARRQRQRVLSPYQIAQLVDGKLAELGQDRTVEDFIAELVCQELERAHKGDAAAARWLIDRFAPPERSPRVSIGRLPKPSRDPLGFLDRVAAAVTAGKLSIDDAAKLSRLAAPFVTDQNLREALARLEALEKRVGELRLRPGLRIVE